MDITTQHKLYTVKQTWKYFSKPIAILHVLDVADVVLIGPSNNMNDDKIIQNRLTFYAKLTESHTKHTHADRSPRICCTECTQQKSKIYM